jgi:hypothetical protein
MNTDLHLEATERTPCVDIDSANGRIELKGESYPEDVASFYGPVVTGLANLAETAQSIEAVFDLIYVNSSSMKALYHLFEILEKKSKTGASVSISWKYQDGDDVMMDLGEDFIDRFPDLNVALIAT